VFLESLSIISLSFWDVLVSRVCWNSWRLSVGVRSDVGRALQGTLRSRSYWTSGVPACALALSTAWWCYRHWQV